MRTLLTSLAALAIAAPVAAQQGDPDNAVAGGGTLPAGWHARTDRDASLDNVKFVTMAPGWHVTTGPAVILWRDTDTGTGSYTLKATLHQTKAPAHPESYGIFTGGKDLSGAGQSYTYYLIRGDGKFLIKRRTGATTANVTDGWTDNTAVRKADAEGKAANTLEVVVTGDKASFRANGTELWSGPASSIDAQGIAGMRVNHNLDLHVAEFGVK